MDEVGEPAAAAILLLHTLFGAANFQAALAPKKRSLCPWVKEQTNVKLSLIERQLDKPMLLDIGTYIPRTCRFHVFPNVATTRSSSE